MILSRIRHELSITRLRTPLVWFHHRDLRAADVMVASYPRSGSTWLRFVLAELLTAAPSDFASVNRSIPAVGSHGKAVPLLPAGGRLIKTHEPYRAEYRRGIYMVRDPRDVVISEYAYQLALGRFANRFDRFVDAFLAGGVNGYGSWQDHVAGWLEAPLAHTGDLLLVRFEDLRAATEATLVRVLGFLGCSANAAAIRAAIANNSINNMRVKELRSPQKASRHGRFVRNGSVGGWRELMSDRHLRLVEQYAGDAMLRLGYLDPEAAGGRPPSAQSTLAR
jgi:Sulfotransferase domain